MGRGKIERGFGVIQQQFLAEIAGDPEGGSPDRHPVASLEAVIGRHAHPKPPSDEDDPAPSELTGIDYLQLVADADAAALAGELRLSALDGTGPEPPDPGARDDSKPGGEEDQR